jgi:hypothetical protein
MLSSLGQHYLYSTLCERVRAALAEVCAINDVVILAAITIILNL